MNSIDIFCSVIDNYGDIGFAYRLVKGLRKKDKNLKIRLFLDDFVSFNKINDKINIDKKIQVIDEIEYINIKNFTKEDYLNIIPNEVVIETFAYDIDENYFFSYEKNLKIVINLEYLTAEEWAEEYHLQKSFINLKGVEKYFYMPGFDSWSGGVILYNKKDHINKIDFVNKSIYKYGSKRVEVSDKDILISIFSYEFNFEFFLKNLYNVYKDKNIYLFLFGDKSQRGFEGLESYANIKIINMSYLNQEDYDIFINFCDFNLVRGEESFVRAMLSGKSFLWHAYCQEDKVHLEKVEGFLKFINKFFVDKKSFESFSKIMYDYNSRSENNYEINTINFEDFFRNIDTFNKTFEEISSFLEKNNLIDKLYDFLVEKVNK